MKTRFMIKHTFVLFMSMSVHLMATCQTQKEEINDQQARINYTSFTVNAVNKKILIDWSTDNKVVTNYFEIQRSRDGINFKTIAMVLGPDPKEKGCDCYEGFDKPSNKKGKYFYRLKHVGIGGEVELSETRMLAVN